MSTEQTVGAKGKKLTNKKGGCYENRNHDETGCGASGEGRQSIEKNVHESDRILRNVGTENAGKGKEALSKGAYFGLMTPMRRETLRRLLVSNRNRYEYERCTLVTAVGSGKYSRVMYCKIGGGE